MLHASGKFVPAIIDHLDQETEFLTPEQMSLLQQQQKLVIANMNKNQNEEAAQQISAELEASSASVKALVVSLKKSNAASE